LARNFIDQGGSPQAAASGNWQWSWS
jgi:hypothetical protein